jgi:hypothetical protein
MEAVTRISITSYAGKKNLGARWYKSETIEEEAGMTTEELREHLCHTPLPSFGQDVVDALIARKMPLSACSPVREAEPALEELDAYDSGEICGICCEEYHPADGCSLCNECSGSITIPDMYYTDYGAAAFAPAYGAEPVTDISYIMHL